MTVVVIKNKRSQLLFAFQQFARRKIKVVRELAGQLKPKVKLSASLSVSQEKTGTIKPVQTIKGRIRVCED